MIVFLSLSAWILINALIVCRRWMVVEMRERSTDLERRELPTQENGTGPAN